jgi:hypothetical protein
MVRAQDHFELSFYKAFVHWRAGMRATKPTAATFFLTRERARALAADVDVAFELVRKAERAAMRSLSARSLAVSNVGTGAGAQTSRSLARQVCAGTARTLAVPAVLALVALSVREAARQPLKLDLLSSEAADACDERRSPPADL